MRVGVLTISDSVARGERVDRSGDAIAAWAVACGGEVVWRSTVPDESVEIVRALLDACDARDVELLVTTGGTGVSPRDVTPEATRAVLEREAPGIAEAVRGGAVAGFPRAALGRGVAGVRGATLVVNLPGSPGGVSDGLRVLGQIAGHAVDVLRGRVTAHEE